MKKCLMTLTLICVLINTSVDAHSPRDSSPQQTGLGIQVIKQQLTLTKQSFKSVGLEKLANGGFAVQVELTAKAAEQMKNLTASNLEHQVNIVWHSYIVAAPIIKSPLPAKFQITGFNEHQAKQFVKEMQKQ